MKMRKPKPQTINNNSGIMGRKELLTAVLSMLMIVGTLTGSIHAQDTQEKETYPVGKPLGVATSGEDFEATTSNVKVYGSIFSAESCSYDAERGLIVVLNRGLPQHKQTNDAWVTLLNHDGSVHTLKWIGVQPPNERKTLSPSSCIK